MNADLEQLSRADLLQKLRLQQEELAQTNRDVLVLTLELDQRVEARTAELLARDQELRAAHQLLEERIAARTAELARSNEALYEANERLRTVVEAAPVGIEILDLDGNVQLWNPAAERLFGWRSDEVLHSPPPVIPEEELEEFRSLLPRFRRGERLDGLERRRTTKEGKPIDYGLWTAPLRDTTGEIQATLVVITDLTAHKELEEQLRQIQRIEAVDRLAGGIAHDFNNLLTIILGHGRLLQNQITGAAKQQIEQILKAADRAASLTSQLLAFSRKQIANRQPLHLNNIIESTQAMLRLVLGERIELVTVLNTELGIVEADPGQIEQILLNLVINARDAMPEGGRITIETSNVELGIAYGRAHLGIAPGKYVLLTVSDTGVGMNENVRKHLFEPFFTTKEVGKGTGLGLSTVYGIIKQSGGGIWVYSEPDKGSTFKVYLPRVARTGETEEAPENVLPEMLQGSETILLVEDDSDVRHLTREILQSHGYAVLACSNGLEALEIYQKHSGPVHLLLTDVVLPKLSGQELAEGLSSKYSNLKVLYMTGYTETAVVQQGLVPEGVPLIQKPFTPEAMAGKVREVLGHDARRLSVLVIDDESGIRAFLKQVLEQQGYEVQEAADGKQAIQEFERRAFDLVITDLVMPGQEGIETIQMLRARSPQLKILAISGVLTGASYLKAARGLGADATLQKPFSSETLVKAVTDLLG